MNRTQYRENIAMALHTLRSHKLRSFLTILGIIIGVLTVIVIASILTGMRQNVVGMVEDFGTRNLYVFHLSTGPQLGPRDRREWQRAYLTVEDVRAIQQQAAAVEEVGYQGFTFWSNTLLQHGKESYRRASVLGVSPNLSRVTNIPIAEGRFFSEMEDHRRSHVAILGINVVEALFPHQEQVVGRSIYLNGKLFTVIGTLQQRPATFLGSSDEDNVVYIPYRTMRKLLPQNEMLMIIVKAREGQLVQAWDQTEAILRTRRNVRADQPNDFDITSADRLVEQFDTITATIGLAAIAISGMGLLVGGIGVMNIMLVSVTERTREIGVRKAVGARRRDLIFQFLFEAMTLTTVGGILGVFLALVASQIIVWSLPDLPASIPAWAVITGLLVSTGVGLLFGVWPAVKAARLDPIECLRYE